MTQDNLPTPASKEDFLAMVEDLRPDIMYPEVWSEEQQETLDRMGRSNLRTKKAMFANIPMVCKNSCPVRQDCPLYQKNQHPLGKKCPIEAAFVMDMAENIALQLAVDMDDFLELSQVRALVNQEVQYMRAQGMLAQEGMIQENTVGVDREGNEITRRELSIAVEMEDRVLKRMENLRKQMLASREAKVKAGQVQKDQILALSDLISDINKEDKTRKTKLREKLDIIDVEANLED